ncbi:MAG TPA: ferredoxin reductase [Amycolatopsis sp.]|nr:ferredoxin reductase [Amycolatopsis sp.]
MLELVEEAPRVRSIVLDLPGWRGHRAGQHVDVRLTADDGYQAQRSYSIASSPEDRSVVLTVERLEDGEVSPYLVDELRVGDELELRGPVGGYFVWEASIGGPLLLVSGGSGIVPFRSMLRHRTATRSTVPVSLLYSARSLDSLIYHDEIMRLAVQDGIDVSVTLTGQHPAGWHGYTRRVDRDMLAEAGIPPAESPRTYICGPTGFVEAAATALVELGHDPSRIRTERFGGSGAQSSMIESTSEG